MQLKNYMRARLQATEGQARQLGAFMDAMQLPKSRNAIPIAICHEK